MEDTAGKKHMGKKSKFDIGAELTSGASGTAKSKEGERGVGMNRMNGKGKNMDKNAISEDKHRKSESLAAFAEANDISLEDLERAYGVSIKSTVTTSTSKKSTTKKDTDTKASGMAIAETVTVKKALTTTQDIFSEYRVSDVQRTSLGKYLSLDCEMVGVGAPPPNDRSALARVSVINYHGYVLLDTFVLPSEPVSDWRTFVSGIRPSDMRHARPFPEVQAQVANMLKGRILVGHSVRKDLEVLMIGHPRRDIRDTSKFKKFRTDFGGGNAPRLKRVVKEVLGLMIQGGEHSSVEDARACMLLYRRFKKEFEAENVRAFGRPPLPAKPRTKSESASASNAAVLKPVQNLADSDSDWDFGGGGEDDDEEGGGEGEDEEDEGNEGNEGTNKKRNKNKKKKKKKKKRRKHG
ncbi:ribonuclease H-like domain-containing protein [Kalaharituber pfeilii]|nr:ribonuclease H-like domain-containing protein [Kalaharituber pfeilii]